MNRINTHKGRIISFANIILTLLLGVLIFLSFTPINTFAQSEPPAQGRYHLITNIPGLPGDTIDRGRAIVVYLANMFQLLLAVSAVLAVFFIIVGGIRYTVSSVSPDEKKAAKRMITNSIIGLLIILSSFIILRTINEDLVESFDLTLSEIGSGGSAPGSSPPPNTPIGEIPNREEEFLIRNNIQNTCSEIGTGDSCNREASNCRCASINRPNPCRVPSTGQGCTSVAGLRDATLSGISEINDSCNRESGLGGIGCTVVVTGGTEPGHACCAHEEGRKVDFRSGTGAGELDAFILNQTEEVGQTSNGLIIREGTLPNGQRIRVLDERGTAAPHWDVEFF